ncbi:MAG: periplasmic heavy metal sensor [Pseudomonadota bacterium]|nr:periplasmic heavy metal sensor [Pseudomonadota bacterium]
MKHPTHTTRWLTRGVLSLATALTLTVASTASAQPMGHGPADPAEMVAHMLQAAKAKLNLNSSQQVAWDNAVASSQAAHQAIRANRQRVRDTMQAELAKPQPDFAAIAAVADDVAALNRAEHVKARNQWLSVYAMLAPDQKTLVRDAIAQRVARGEAFRERMRQRFHGPG